MNNADHILYKIAYVMGWQVNTKNEIVEPKPNTLTEGWKVEVTAGANNDVFIMRSFSEHLNDALDACVNRLRQVMQVGE